MLLLKISQIKIFSLHFYDFAEEQMMMIVFNSNDVAFENNNKNVVLDDQTQQDGFHEINKT